MLLGACKNRPELLNDFEMCTLVPGRPLREVQRGNLMPLPVSAPKSNPIARVIILRRM